MLGKGLESLIPNLKKADGGSQKPAETSAVPPAASAPSTPASSAPSTPALQKEESRISPDLKTSLTGERPVRSSRTTAEGNAVFQIEVEKIKPNPFQPRRDFHEESLKELADSIREFGIIQPLVVTKVEKEVPTGTDVEYQLIAGERRLMAAKLLGLPRVPVIIRKVDADRERLEMAIIENLQRENLNPIERARAFSRLQDEFRLTQREIATQLGKSREAVANTIRLLDLPSEIQDAVSKGEVSETHGRLLLSVTDRSAQEKLFRDLLGKRFTTRDFKAHVEAVKSGRPREESGASELSPELKMLQEKLSSELGTPVKIETRGAPPEGGGKITITYYSGEELKNIVERLGGEKGNF